MSDARNRLAQLLYQDKYNLTPPAAVPNYGMRPDGTRKGNGWLGAIPHYGPDGAQNGVSTELTFEAGGHQMPLIVPTLNPDQLRSLQHGGPLTPDIAKTAIDFARSMARRGRSPYYDSPK